MKKKGVAVEEKILIVHKHGVREEFREQVQKQYPKALVKVINESDVIKEAIEFKKKVDHVVCMPEVAKLATEIAQYWPGSTSSIADSKWTIET